MNARDYKESWIKVGYEVFALSGPSALKIDPLAKKVGKSKSSFYHHFAIIAFFSDDRTLMPLRLSWCGMLLRAGLWFRSRIIRLIMSACRITIKNAMLRSSIGFLLGVAVMGLFAFTTNSFKVGRATAEVVSVDGFYIFTDCKPVMAYDSLGAVELGFVTGTQYNSIRENLIKRSRKKYPEGDGLILQLSNSGVDRCVVVKFK